MPLFRCIYLFFIYFSLKVYLFSFNMFLKTFLGGWGLGLMPLFRCIYFLGEGVVGLMPLSRCIYFVEWGVGWA